VLWALTSSGRLWGGHASGVEPLELCGVGQGSLFLAAKRRRD
jgi:hypothetical protein